MFKVALAVGTILLVGALHLPAVLADWYFYFWWYDVMMHTLGGVAMGFLAIVVWDWLITSPLAPTGKSLLLQGGFVLGFVALVGIGWEWSEAFVDALVLPYIGLADAQLGLRDTMLDLFFDLVGGWCGWLVVRFGEERRFR